MNCEFFLGEGKGEGRREREEGREVDNGAEVYKGEKKSTANFPTNIELMTPTVSTLLLFWDKIFPLEPQVEP